MNRYFFDFGSMPIFENRLGSKLCDRLEFRITSPPPGSSITAQSPSGTILSPKYCHALRSSFLTLTSASIGAPAWAPVFPPKRSGKVAPSPAEKQVRTAIGSQRVPTAKSRSPRFITARSNMVLSPGTPPPGLSQTSVRTIGLASDANA